MMFIYEPLQRDMPVLANQQELICISSVQTLDVVRVTSWEQRMIGKDGERESVCQEDMCCYHNNDEDDNDISPGVKFSLRSGGFLWLRQFLCI